MKLCCLAVGIIILLDWGGSHGLAIKNEKEKQEVRYFLSGINREEKSEAKVITISMFASYREQAQEETM